METPESGIHPSEPVRPHGKRLTVVVADDDRDLLLTLMMILRDEGHDAYGAQRGDDVLPLVRKTAPHAVVLDIGMPGNSGYTVAQDIRSEFPGKAKPLLIAITGKWTKASDRMLSELAGFDHYIVKPCDPNRVLELLKPLSLPAGET